MGDSIKSAEHRMQEIAELKKQVWGYRKTKDVYAAYKKSGWSKKFFEAHREALTIHKAAKDAFNKFGKAGIPKVKDLNAEYAMLLERKKAAYPAYKKARAQMQEFLIAQRIAAVLLEKEKEQAEIETRRKEQEHGSGDNR